MVAKAQDILVALELSLNDTPRSFAALGEETGLSASEAHSAVRRLTEARLLDPETQLVQRNALHNFLVHGVPFVFPARPKEITRGIPTAWAAPMFKWTVADPAQLPPVWPDPNGKSQGQAVKPLYPSVPAIALRNPALYRLLALVDALRLGRARERKFAEAELSKDLVDAHT